MNEQLTALRLAAVVSYLDGSEKSQLMMDAAAELRRQALEALEFNQASRRKKDKAVTALRKKLGENK